MAVKISAGKKKALDVTCDAAAFFFEKDFDNKVLKDLETVVPNLKNIIKAKKFHGSLSTVILVPTATGNQTFVALVGLGEKKAGKINIENLRRGIGSLVRLCDTNSIENLSVELPEASLFKVEESYLAKQVASILVMANYKFDKFLTHKSAKEKQLSVVVSSSGVKVKQGLEDGAMIGECVNDARQLVDSPPNILRPETFAKEAEDIAKKHGLKIKVFGEKEIQKMGMGGLAAVSSGSAEDCKFIILEYKCKNKNAPHLAFVGKGITFDSGGLSLKPAEYMDTMKEDMSGAAAVLASMKAIAQLKPEVNITGFMPLSENTPSGESDKPGDIITFYNGKTAEIINTDAEGRLILADALSYAEKNYKLDAIIDIATLTGACEYALGPFFSGLFSEDENLINKIKEAAELSGDYVWRLPLTDDYKVANKCAVADLSNCGSKTYKFGATTAASFLQNFVEKTPWVHLDIAGTAFGVPDLAYFRPSSATGVGTRLLLELAFNWK